MENKKYLSGEYFDDKGIFWLGANGCEYIARQGSHQIFIYPSWEFPNMPSGCIQYSKRIETLEDFDDALDNGVEYTVSYNEKERKENIANDIVDIEF